MAWIRNVCPGLPFINQLKRIKILGKTNSAGTLVVSVKSSNILISVYDQKGIYESSDTYFEFTGKTTSDPLKIECFPESQNNIANERRYEALDQKYDQLGMTVEDSVDQEAEFYGGFP